MKDFSHLPFPIELLSENEDESSDGLPIISINDDDTQDDDLQLDTIVVLPVKNTVLFPKVVIPITVSRKKSIRLIKKAYKGDKIVGVLAQNNPEIGNPTSADMRMVGTAARILRMLVLPDGNTTIILQGIKRFKVTEFLTDEPSIMAKIDLLHENFPSRKEKEVKAMIASLKEASFKILQLNPEIPQEAQTAIKGIENPNFLTNFLSSNINATVHEKQSLLETEDGMVRAEKLLEFMHRDIQVLEIKREIHDKVHTDIDQQQRDYFLRQQIKVIQDELGHENNEREVEILRLKAKGKKWNEATAKVVQKEIDKLARTNSASPEYAILFNYVELLVELPWGEFSEDSHDLKKAREVLEKDHFGLDKVKERILEYLAVLKLKNDMKAPILCLYGPPGVGKTSLGKSIAKALNRKCARIALGGLHDEGEIRGHRKTYIGAMPGRIIQSLRKMQTSNPVFILDEIDKVGADHRGDPASALLEVLDPEQNHSFADNYLEVEYDLSNILFIATANNLDTIHPALRDRMEIIDLSGYTIEEKLQIAKRHLLPEQRKENGLQPKDFKIDDKALLKLIQDYTRESGVRNLKRQIGSVCRKIAKSIALEEEYTKNVREDDIPKLLGTEVFDREQYQQPNQAGVVTGLAWTSVGGEILFIECSLSKGKGKLTLSGQLGEVMKESATAALSYLKSVAEDWGIDYTQFDTHDLHLHVPAGAVPKDGPSAGIAMFTALLSIFTGKLVRNHLAMTGEITLTGRVLPVGGIKEKILAAKRAGITDIILCERNRKDIEEINQEYLKGLQFHFVRHASEVAKVAIV